MVTIYNKPISFVLRTTTFVIPGTFKRIAHIYEIAAWPYYYKIPTIRIIVHHSGVQSTHQISFIPTEFVKRIYIVAKVRAEDSYSNVPLARVTDR